MTYRNEEFNFELDYPVSWFIEETDYGTRFWSFVPGTLPIESFHALPLGQTRLTVSPSITPDPTPLAEVITRDIQEMALSGGCIYSDPIVFLLASGEQAIEVRATSDHGGDYATIYTSLDGRHFIFDVWGNIWDDTNSGWKIARSLRPITSTNHIDQQDSFDAIHIPDQYFCAQ